MSRQDYHQEHLSLFVPAPTDTSILSREWIDFRPVNQVTDASVLDFNIPPQGASYIDLKRSVLNIKVKLIRGDGSPLQDGEGLAPVNLTLHSIFRQVDVTFQQKNLPHTGTNYPYKAYIDTILNTSVIEHTVLGGSQLFYKDTGDASTNDVKTGSNNGLYIRAVKTKLSTILDLEGPLHLDIFQQPRLLVNGVSIGLKLWQGHDSFRIITDSLTPDYKIQIVDARFKLCVLKPTSAMLLANEKMIQEVPAMYPYLRSDIKTVSVAAGQYGFSADDMFQGLVPSKLIVGLVSSAAYNGDYGKNPFNFGHYDLNSLGLYIDGQAIPTQPLQPNYASNQYTECYRTLTQHKKDIHISFEDYKKGYCFYILNVDPFYTFNSKRRGHCRLELKFGTALPESVTMIMYASFPEILHIDRARAVFVK